ncbi:MAG: (Fe-S)-binding protein [Terriglobia bacterium]|jgi:Fe-S oxidoreductase
MPLFLVVIWTAFVTLTAFGLFSTIIFIAVAAGSCWLFARTLWKRLSSMYPRIGELPRDHVAERLQRVFLEVMLQSRVIRDRPVTGALHALMMWGFFAFAWVSLKHLSLGIRGLDAASGERSWYGGFVAFWALAVALGITGLAFRRFVLRPKFLGRFSPTSALVAALILALMATYLLGWGIYSPGTAAWKVNWWTHTGVFFALLIIIPHSKHLHLLLAPFAIFFRSERTSAMRPLREVESDGTQPQEDDLDLGMFRFADLGAKDILDLNACVECGRCAQFCPVNRTGGSLNPKELILSMQKGFLAGGAGSNTIAGNNGDCGNGTARVAESDLFQCLSCGACEYACPTGIEHVGRKILDLRRALVSNGLTTNEKVAGLFRTMERSPHNPWGIGQERRRKFVAAHEFPIWSGKEEWLLWLGCGLSYDPHGQSVAVAMRKILDAAGVSFGVFTEEVCCGEPARRAGNEYLYLTLAESVIEMFSEKKVKNILTCCPHCATALDKDYRQIEAYAKLGVRVVHHSEFIAGLLPRLDLQGDERAVSYHDPCYLARTLGVTGVPRRILKACGASLLEPENHGLGTSCCGAGGAQIFIADDTLDRGKERVNHARFAELVGTGASMAAVACPHCLTMLRDAANHANRDDFAILDIAEIVAESIRQDAMETSNAIITQETTLTIRGREYRSDPAANGLDYIGPDGVRYRCHANGQGLVAETASVDGTVHVGPQCRVFDHAVLTDGVRLTGRAEVGGHVVASHGVNFGGEASITEGTFAGPKIVVRRSG